MRKKVLNYLFQAFCCAICFATPALIAFVLNILFWQDSNYFAIYVPSFIIYFLAVSQIGLFVYYHYKKLKVKWVPFIIILGTVCSIFIIMILFAKFFSARFHIDGSKVFFYITIALIFVPKRFIKLEDNSNPDKIVDDIDDILNK